VLVELRPEDLPHALLDLHRVVTQAVLRGPARWSWTHPRSNA
jgi:lauroyl/myristoyl acyltransferase